MSREVFLALADSFLWEERSENPLGYRKAFCGEYVNSIEDIPLKELENAFVVVEPYEHVGVWPFDNKGVRASENIAWLIDQIFGLKTYVIPAWKMGIRDLRTFSMMTKISLGVIFEGGESSVYNPHSFSQRFSRKEATTLLVNMMMTNTGFLSICFSHQVTAYAHSSLLRQAVDSMLVSEDENFIDLAKEINHIGNSMKVIKEYGVVADTWDDDTFAVARNEKLSCGKRMLYPHVSQSHEHIPDCILPSYDAIAAEFSTTIDKLLINSTARVQSFHADEVAEEAIMFFCWAYSSIHNTVNKHKTNVATNPHLSFLLNLPIGVEITSSTKDDKDKHVICEAASTAIYWERQTAQTTQFHPELDETLFTASEGWSPGWQEMKSNESIRLLVCLLKDMIIPDERA